MSERVVPNACTGNALRRVRGWYVLSALVVVLLVAYAGWWGFWLGHGRLPMSPLKALAGIPSPTTGCTRSLACLARGDLVRSFSFNPFTLPILALFATSLVWLLVCVLRRRRAVLPRAMALAWLVLLGAAWAVKLLSDPRWW